ncbi:hypothetical protein NEOLEDRAFT_1077420, partial [Neolentinus lepideus HHB14362 ss-1]
MPSLRTVSDDEFVSDSWSSTTHAFWHFRSCNDSDSSNGDDYTDGPSGGTISTSEVPDCNGDFDILWRAVRLASAHVRRGRSALTVIDQNTGVNLRCSALQDQKPHCAATVLDENARPTLDRTAACPRDLECVFPDPIVALTKINGCDARTLLDSGSMANFMSTMFGDIIHVSKTPLAWALPVQLAVMGSRSKINYCATARFQFEGIDCEKWFDIINVDDYDIILGTPFLFQHRVLMGLNPPSVLIGSPTPLPIVGANISHIPSMAASLVESELDKLHQMLRSEAEDLTVIASTGLPPLQDVNHTIPLVNKSAVYPWQPARCPEKYKEMFQRKKQQYLERRVWQLAQGNNACPMLVIAKP